MGVFHGYDEIRDGEVVRGTIRGGDPFWAPDGDFNMNVRPAPGYEHLLTNPSGFKNANGFIQCEVEPAGASMKFPPLVPGGPLMEGLPVSPGGPWIDVS